MAKKNRTDEGVDFDNPEAVSQAAAASQTNGDAAEQQEAGAPAVDNRYKKLKLKDGTEVNRVDYIRSRWKAGASRSTIAKEVSELAGQKVPYQIVFAATKNVPGGPPKTTAAAEATSNVEHVA